jgi:RNA polymerase sigma factor (sigma-70 family)
MHAIPKRTKTGLAFFGKKAKSRAMNDPGREFIPTRRSLLTRLKHWDDRESWQDFFDTYWKLIYGVAIRAGLSDSDSQDVVQETIVAVARQMPNFKYDPALGSFKSWLFLITRRRIADHLRKEYRRPKPDDPGCQDNSRTALLERIPDPASANLSAIWDEEWKRQLFDAALQKVKRNVEPKHLQIFDCYVRKEWPVKEVARTFAVSPGQVYLIKHRISALIAKEIQALQTSLPEV